MPFPQEYYDLLGLTVTSISLSWPPYLVIGQCDEQGRRCRQNYGALVDISGTLAGMFNMTVQSFKEPTGDWGAVPGNESSSLERGGVMGKVLYREQVIVGRSAAERGQKESVHTGDAWRLRHEPQLLAVHR